MKFHLPSAEIFIPDGRPVADALARVTHLGIGAHQDDLEFMAFHGILQCFDSDSDWFGGVTCTNGSGSARSGSYADYSDGEMMRVRREEQRQAAVVGRYGAMVQLDYPSAVAKDPADLRLREDLRAILAATRPRVVYTHNPADKHDTHIAVVVPVIQAIRSLPRNQRPEAVHGCEGWRDLDWLGDTEKVVHDVGGRENLAAALNGIFDSQIAGGKRYDLAVLGRRRANATFFQSHGVDQSDALSFAMDLTPLAHDDSLDIVEFVTGAIDRFRADVAETLGEAVGTMNARVKFHEQLKRLFVPVLRKDGFTGSGSTFRRVNGDVIHVLHVQGSVYGGQCCICLGIHLSFLPCVGAVEPSVPNKITEPQCEFRQRLAPPGEADEWWPYGSNESDARESAISIVDRYREVAVPSFARFSKFPDDFVRIGPDDLGSSDELSFPQCSEVRRALALSRIFVRLGRIEEAKKCAEFGFAHAGPALALKGALRAILDRDEERTTSANASS